MAQPPQSNRRQFLIGQAAGDALVHVVGEAAERAGRLAERLDPTPEEDLTAGYVSVLQRKAMACSFEIRLNVESAEPQLQFTAPAMEALDLIDQLESQLSVYRDTSDISRINRSAAEAPVDVEEGLFSLLRQSARIHHDTQGAFDLTSGPLSRVWGFHVRQGRLPPTAELAAARKLVGWPKVQLDVAGCKIFFAQQGLEINVNSIGKGYALDRAADLLRAQGVSDFLFHGGRSTLIASGSRKGHKGWHAGLRHPLYPSVRFALFRLQDQALSTSGSGTQFFQHRGKRYGHLIDPRTGCPAEGMHSVTVIAPTAAEADAMSTAFYVMGREATAAYCRERPHLKVLMVLPASGEGQIEVECLNLSDEEWQLRASAE